MGERNRLHNKVERLKTALPMDLLDKSADCALTAASIYVSIHALLTTCLLTLHLAGRSCLPWIGTHDLDHSDPYQPENPEDEATEVAESCWKTCEEFLGLLQYKHPKIQRMELFCTPTVGQACFAMAVYGE